MKQTEKRKALLKWSREEDKWILMLWIDGDWEFSKSWSLKDKDPSGNGYVYDSIICELANLQRLGYATMIMT